VIDAVAPFTGAWIETRNSTRLPEGWMSRPSRARGLKRAGFGPLTRVVVAPFTGAWIETGCVTSATAYTEVAPFTGAWIETLHS